MHIGVHAVRHELEKAKHIILTSHLHPDGDAIGSCLALAHLLKGMGKQVQIVLDDCVPAMYDVLPGFEEIQRYAGEPLRADLAVLLDARPGRDGRICSAISAPVLNIDHHVSNMGAAELSYVDSDASATAVILYRFFRDWGIDITVEIACCLYLGIATDTGFFSFPNTTVETMEICAELIRRGVRPDQIALAVSRKSFNDMKEFARGLQTLELFANGKAVGVFLDESFEYFKNTDELIEMIRFLDGVSLAVLLKAEKKGCRIRMRSCEVDVSRLAAKLGGGGHCSAAGATISGGFDEVKALLRSEIGHFLISKNITHERND